MADPIFVKGLFIRRPNERTKEKAPWVKLHLGVKVDELIEFLQANKKKDGFVNLDIKASKAGDKLYAELDTYVPKSKEEDEGVSVYGTDEIDKNDEVDVKDLPF